MKRSLPVIIFLFILQHVSAGNTSFTQNKGQVVDSEGKLRPDVLYTAQLNNATLYFFADRIAYVLTSGHSTSPSEIANGARADQDSYRFDLVFPGSSAVIEKGDPLPGYSNYYLAHCPQGITHVPSYRSIVYKGLYHNVDLRVDLVSGHAKFTLLVKEVTNQMLTDLGNIEFEGADRIDALDGNYFVLATRLGIYRQPAFVIEGENADVSRIQESGMRMATSNTWCTYIGGTDGDEGWGIDADNASMSYVAGYTQSLDLPVGTGTVQSSGSGNYDAYLFKLDNTGNRVWATYYGGTGNDFGYKVKLSGSSVVMCGYGSSTDLPMAAAAWQNASAGSYDAFIIKLDAAGALYRSTYFGGTGGEFALAMDIDNAGNIVMGGSTSSAGLPLTTNAYQPANAGPLDAYCVKFDSTLAGVWCTFYGGSSSEDVHALALDDNGNVVFGGGTYSSDLPVSAGAYQPAVMSIPDCYLVKLDAAGNRLWATFLGGGNMEDANSITTDKWDNIYVTGFTQSIDFPVTAGAFQSNLQGGSDMFVTKFGPGGDLKWSTLYGGTMDDYGTGIVSDTNYYVFIGGYTRSTDFPVNAAAPQINNAGNADAFFVRLDTAGVPGWATYFGGSFDDNANEIAIDPAWDVFIAGTTYSLDLPDTNGVMQPLHGSNGDAFAAKLDGSYGITVSVSEHSPVDLYLYPNPAKNEVYIDVKEGENILVTDIAGRTLKKLTLTHPGVQAIDVSSLPQGVYYIISGEKERRVAKLIKL